MTNEQIAWLKKNPDYRPIGVAPGLHLYRRRGTLNVDGTFIPWSPQTPIMTGGGSFGVGVLEPISGAMQGQQPGLQKQASAGGVGVAPADAGPGPLAAPTGELPKKV